MHSTKGQHLLTLLDQNIRLCPRVSRVALNVGFSINIFRVFGDIPFKKCLSKICILSYSAALPGHLSSIEAKTLLFKLYTQLNSPF